MGQEVQSVNMFTVIIGLLSKAFQIQSFGLRIQTYS